MYTVYDFTYFALTALVPIFSLKIALKIINYLLPSTFEVTGRPFYSVTENKIGKVEHCVTTKPPSPSKQGAMTQPALINNYLHVKARNRALADCSFCHRYLVLTSRLIRIVQLATTLKEAHTFIT